jgi:hypothetical protein
VPWQTQLRNLTKRSYSSSVITNILHTVLFRWDIDDSYAALERSSGDDAEEQLGSVLPSGAVVAAGEGLQQHMVVNTAVVPSMRVTSSSSSSSSVCNIMLLFATPWPL